MIRDKTIQGSYLDIKLEPKAFPLHADGATIEPQIITLRFEMDGKKVNDIRAELVFDHAAYTKAEQAGTFGLSADTRKKAMGDTAFEPGNSVHVLVRADMDRIGPYQFDGLDIKNNENDLTEILTSVLEDTASDNPYHQADTWSFITAQQKNAPDGKPIGFDHAG